MQESSRRGINILTLAFMTAVLTYGIRFGYGVVMPKMKETLSFSDTEAGLIAGAYFTAYTVFSPSTGYLTDRFGGRKIVSMFCALIGMGALAMGFSYAWWLSAAAFFVAGLGSTAGWTGVVAVVSNWFPLKRKVQVIGVLMAGTMLGYGLMGALLPVLIGISSWRFAWVALGLLTLSIAGVNLLFLKDSAHAFPQLLAEGASVAGHTAPQSPLKIVSTLPFWLMGASYLLVSYGTYVPLTFLVAYLYRELSFPYALAAGFASIFAFSAIVGAVLLPMLSNRIGRKTSLAVYNALLGASILALGVSPAVALLLALATASIGFFYGGVVPAYAALASDYFTTRVAGTALGLWTIYYGVGAITSPIVSGFIKDTSGFFLGAFIIGGVACWMSALLVKIAAKPNVS